MNEREAEKYVRKDNVWKKPDYPGMIARGTPTDVVYFIKKVRDSLSASPYYYHTDDTPEKRLARQEQYIDTVRALQSVMEKVRSRENAMQAYERFMLDGGYWDSNVELTARAFACYVQDRLPYRSDYLDGHAECAVSLVSRPDGAPEVIRAYPQGAEREAINAVFDEIVADLKLEHIFTHSEQPLSLAKSERHSVLGQLAAGKQQQKAAPETAKAKSEPEI